MILEGSVTRVTDAGLLDRYADAYKAKYEFRPDPLDPGAVTFVLIPRVAFGWLERSFSETATRWTFG